MGWNGVSYPAGWVAVTTPRVDGLFLSTDALTFALSAATAQTYQVRDYYGNLIASGNVSGTSLTLSALPLGWYKLYLLRATSDATYGNLIGTTLFSIILHDANLPDPPVYGSAVGANSRFEGRDQVARGIAMFGPDRNQIGVPSGSSTTAVQVAELQAERAYQQTWYDGFAPDSARPRPAFVQFPDGGYQDATHTDGVTAAVAALYPDIGYFEGPINEPNLYTSAADAVGWMQTFYDAVKAGNAAAKVIGPGPVSINNGAQGWQALETFLAAGGGAHLDGLSFHAYNCINGDMQLGRRTMTQLQRVLTAHGLGSLPLWQTECGAFGATYGVFTPRRQARWWAMQRFIFDEAGLPKERDYWFYDTSHGFWDFPSFWKTTDAVLMPLIAMARTYSREVYGKARTASLDFGTTGNDLYIGGRFTATDTSAVLALLSNGRTDGSILLQVAGASTVTAVDCFGNTTTLPVVAGIATVPVTVEPTYVRLPVGVTATVEQIVWGPNVAREGSRNTSPGTVSPQSVTNGVRESFYGQGPGDVPGFSDDHALPSTLTVELVHDNDNTVKARRIDTVLIDCATPWQSQGTLLDFDVEYRDTTGSWHTLQTIAEPGNTFASATNQSQVGCTIDSYHSGRCVFVTTFNPVTAEAVRLTVRDATYGGEVTAAAVAAGGQGASNAAIRVREIGAYCRAAVTA